MVVRNGDFNVKMEKLTKTAVSEMTVQTIYNPVLLISGRILESLTFLISGRP